MLIISEVILLVIESKAAMLLIISEVTTLETMLMVDVLLEIEDVFVEMRLDCCAIPEELAAVAEVLLVMEDVFPEMRLDCC